MYTKFVAKLLESQSPVSIVWRGWTAAGPMANAPQAAADWFIRIKSRAEQKFCRMSERLSFILNQPRVPKALSKHLGENPASGNWLQLTSVRWQRKECSWHKEVLTSNQRGWKRKFSFLKVSGNRKPFLAIVDPASKSLVTLDLGN